MIIDTDIGDDIDDALAIGYAMNLPDVNLIGVTTVYKNTVLRAKIARALLAKGGLNIPVFAGESQPCAGQVSENEMPCQYMEVMAGNQIDLGAVDFILKTCSANPGEIELVCIGPLTNIARCIEAGADFKRTVKQITLMGGAFTFHNVEYNIAADVEAARIVFECGIKIVAVGIDVTQYCRLSNEQVEMFRLGNSVNQLLYHLVALYRQKHGSWPVFLHDPLCLAPQFLTLEEAEIKVETKGEITRGLTFNNRRSQWWLTVHPQSTTSIAIDVASDAFVKHFMMAMTR